MKLKKQVILILLMIFSFNIFTNKAKALPSSYERVEYGIEEYDDKPPIGSTLEENAITNNRLVVCQYACGEAKSGNEVGKCGMIHEANNIITYGIEKNDWNIYLGVILKERERDTITLYAPKLLLIPNWEEVTVGGDLSRDPMVYIYKWDSTLTDSLLPEVYYGSSTNGDEEQVWEYNSESYNNLRKSFICPKYEFYDESLRENYCPYEGCDKNSMELCYSDDQESCKTRNTSSYTKFENPSELSYSFAEELNNTLETLKTKINDMTPRSFLNQYGLSESDLDEFTDNLCDLMGNEELGNQINQQITITEHLDKLLQESRKSAPASCGIRTGCSIHERINEKFFYVEPLSKLLIEGKGIETKTIKYNGKVLNDEYKNIIENVYPEKLKTSIESFKNECEVKRGRKYDVDTEEISENVKNTITKIITNYEEIDVKELECDNIFAGLSDMIRSAYFFLEIGAILIAILFTILDYAKIFLSDNQDDMKKANKRLTQRLIIVTVIFLLPAIINMTLKIFKIQGFDSAKPLCRVIEK